MQLSSEALQQEIRYLEERLEQARRALLELQGGISLDDGLELIELTENDIVTEPEPDQLVERATAPVLPVVDPWAGVSVAAPDEGDEEKASKEAVWPQGGAGERDPLKTGTLAELYVSQGLTERAVEIYRDILAVEPDNAAVAARLAELESAQLSAASAATAAAEQQETMAAVPKSGVADANTVLPVLEGWLENIRRLRECR